LQVSPKLFMIRYAEPSKPTLIDRMDELSGTTASDRLPLARPGDGRRWGVCLTLALTLHVAGAAALLAYWRADAEEVANAPLIMIELAALPAAPETAPSDLPPGPQQEQAAPSSPAPPVVERDAEPAPQQPAEKIETAVLPPAPQAEEPVAAAPPPKPAEQPQQPKHRSSQAQIASAPSTTPHRAERAAAPAPGASARNANALPSWKSALVNRLERYKRYPAEARGEHGVARLAFSVDRGGGVHHARIVRSSGSGALDRATLALIERAQPLPPPPPEIRGAQIAIVVPIRYSIR
jgi:protein TonB